MNANKISSGRSKSVAKDLNALRKNMSTNDANGLGAQILAFIIVILFIAMAGFWFLRIDKSASSILLYDGGFSVAGAQEKELWLGEATEQAIISYLNVGERLHIIGGRDVKSVPENPNGTDWIVSGTILIGTENTEVLDLVLQLKSNDENEQIFSTRLTGVKIGISDLASRASAQIFTWLEQPALSIEQLATAAAELPASQNARQAYSEGLEALERFDAARAVPKFEVALRDGDHPLVYAGLARAWSQLGYRRRAKQAAEKAYENRENLSRQKQLEVEGHFRIINDEWSRATEVYQALKEFHPNDLSYRLALADVQLKASDMQGVLQNIDDMRNLLAPLNEDPRIDLTAVEYWHQKGNYAKAAAAAQRAIKKARASGDNAVLASALLADVDNEGNNKIDHLLEARQLYDQLNNPGQQSSVLKELGEQARYDGKIPQAEKYYYEAIQVAQSISDAPRIAAAQNALAITLDLKGELENGLDLKQEVQGYYAQRDVKSRQSIMLENIGISLFKLGRLQEAEASFDEALNIFIPIDDTIGIAWAPYHRSRIASRSGDLGKAVKLAETAVENSVETPAGDLEHNARYEIAHTLYHRGLYAQAKVMFNDLEQNFGQKNNKLSAAESALMLARIALQEKDYAFARKKMNAARKTYESGGVGYYILDANITRADLAFIHYSEDQDAACTALRQNLKGMEHVETALRARSRLLRCNGAVNDLTSVETAARDTGMFEPQLDAIRIRAQLWEKAGQQAFADQARTRGRELAAAKGWAFE